MRSDWVFPSSKSFPSYLGYHLKLFPWPGRPHVIWSLSLSSPSSLGSCVLSSLVTATEPLSQLFTLPEASTFFISLPPFIQVPDPERSSEKSFLFLLSKLVLLSFLSLILLLCLFSEVFTPEFVLFVYFCFSPSA